MNSSKKSSTQEGKTILLSIKPKYANLILTDEKTVELRRMWAAQEIENIVIYSSSPIKRLVGIAKIQEVIKAKPDTLWTHCRQRGGGLTKQELLDYFHGKSTGYAILIDKVIKFETSIEPTDVIEKFTAPQSFRYMSSIEMQTLKRKYRSAKQ